MSKSEIMTKLARWTVAMQGGWTMEVDAPTAEAALRRADRLARLIDQPDRALTATEVTP